MEVTVPLVEPVSVQFDLHTSCHYLGMPLVGSSSYISVNRLSMHHQLIIIYLDITLFGLSAAYKLVFLSMAVFYQGFNL